MKPWPGFALVALLLSCAHAAAALGSGHQSVPAAAAKQPPPAAGFYHQAPLTVGSDRQAPHAVSSNRLAPLAVGFDRVMIPVPGGRALPGAFWFPSDTKPAVMRLTFFDQNVAANGTVAGRNLPLIVISHGASGSDEEEANLSMALAGAGFVVAAITHDEFGPHWQFRPAKRNVQLHALIKYALADWTGHAHLDPRRVGAFGYSLGGFTILVAIGGRPNATLVAPHCKVAPKEWSCAMEATNTLDLTDHHEAQSGWIADPRIKAAVVAAPALGYVFGKPGLQHVQIPVQLWQAQKDHTLAEPWNAEAVLRDLPTPPEYHLVAGADHGDFSGLCSRPIEATNPKFCGSGTSFDRRKFFKGTFEPAIIGFFQHALSVPQ